MRLLRIAKEILAANEDLWRRNSPQGRNYPGDTSSEPYYVDGNLSSLFTDFYKLEYAYLKVSQSSLMEKRKERILGNIEQTLSEVAQELKELFVNVFGDWLKKHAILNPNTWARQRAESTLEQDDWHTAWEACLHEFKRYYGGGRYKNLFQGPGLFKIMKELTQEIFAMPEIIPVLDQVLDKDAEKQEIIDRMMYDWESDPVDITEQLKLSEDAEEDEVREAVEKFAEEEVNSLDYIQMYISNWGEDYILERISSNNDLALEFLTLVYEKKVFPLWMNFWGPQGIKETRETVEHAYQHLVNAKSVQEISSALSEATQVSHQTGEMLEYVCNAAECSKEELKQTLDELTEGDFMDAVNEDLKSVGVAV